MTQPSLTAMAQLIELDRATPYLRDATDVLDARLAWVMTQVNTYADDAGHAGRVAAAARRLAKAERQLASLTSERDAYRSR